MTIEAIFAADREQPPATRSLPWLESKAGVTVVVEPKPHWANDLRAFQRDAQEYCYYRDWLVHGPRARFFAHVDTSGADVLRKARMLIEQEIRDGLWQWLQQSAFSEAVSCPPTAE